MPAVVTSSIQVAGFMPCPIGVTPFTLCKSCCHSHTVVKLLLTVIRYFDSCHSGFGNPSMPYINMMQTEGGEGRDIPISSDSEYVTAQR